MYRLLIVDDEPTVRFGLRSYFNWSSYGIEVMGEADDGDVALEMVEEEQPDLILTDVRMPNMDGISMSQQISARYPQCKIIFVSGHDDADYLKSALKISAADYIFKPVNLQELSAVITRVIADLDAERAEKSQKEELLVKLNESMPLLREKFLLSLIGSGTPKLELRERIDFLGLDLPIHASYWVIVVSVDDLADIIGGRSERDRQLLWYAVLNICQELIDSYLRGYAFEYQNGEFVAVLTADTDGEIVPDAAEALFALAGDIQTNMDRWLKIGVTIGISDRVIALSDLTHAYKQAREATDHKWYLGKNRIITMDSMESLELDAVGINRYDHVHNGQLMSALKAADADKLREALDLIFADLNLNRRDGLKYARNVCLQVVLAVGQLILELSVQSPELESLESSLWEALFEKETLSEMRHLIESYLTAVCERIREKRTGKLANLVERVRAVIELNYADGGLTAAEIGKAVYLTPTYVSLLFKQETGQTINEYLTQVRVDKAKELLRDPQNKFYDICYAIGYTDPSYFTKLFKKATGVTPSVYRDSYA
jgi:two-component system response regulator YesN